MQTLNKEVVLSVPRKVALIGKDLNAAGKLWLEQKNLNPTKKGYSTVALASNTKQTMIVKNNKLATSKPRYNTAMCVAMEAAGL